MKNVFCSLVFLSFSIAVRSQCTVTVPTTAIVLNQDTTLNLMAPGGPNFPYLVCEGVNVFITGLSTWYFDLYVMPGASVEIDDTMNFFYVNCNIYLQENATFDFNHKIGSDIDSMFYEPTSNLVDTIPQSTVWVPCNDLVFDFSLWPNGQSPCTGSTGVNSGITTPQIVCYPNPAGEFLFIESPASGKNYWLSDISGRLLQSGELLAGTNALPLSEFAPGVYLLSIPGLGFKKIIVE